MAGSTARKGRSRETESLTVCDKVIHRLPLLIRIDNRAINQCNSGLFRNLIRRHRNEAHLSALENPPRAAPWLPGAYAYTWGPGSDKCPPRQRTSPPVCVTVTRATLPHNARLSGSAHFTGSFDQRFSGTRFQVLVRANQTTGVARLGIVVGRRSAPRAVDRARARRIIREEFRRRRATLGPVDVVVRVKSAVTSLLRDQAREEIRQLLRKVAA